MGHMIVLKYICWPLCTKRGFGKFLDTMNPNTKMMVIVLVCMLQGIRSYDFFFQEFTFQGSGGKIYFTPNPSPENKCLGYYLVIITLNLKWTGIIKIWAL